MLPKGFTKIIFNNLVCWLSGKQVHVLTYDTRSWGCKAKFASCRMVESLS